MDLYLCEGIARREDAYTLLAYAVRHRWGFDSLPAIVRGQQGKPHLPAHPHCHFNLSHSGTFALCAVDEHPVGADIERIRPHHLKLAQRVCSAEELLWMEEQPDKTVALCQLWAHKEALAKYSGTGLTVPLREIRIPLPPANQQGGLLFHSAITPEFCLCACGHTSVQDVISVPREEIVR